MAKAEKEMDLRTFLRDQLNNSTENTAQEALEELRKQITKELKIAKSFIVNEQYQEYVENLTEAKAELDGVFEKSKDIIILVGQNRVPTKARLVGYNSSSGDIFVEYKNEKGRLETKIVKEKSVVSDIGRIPVQRKKTTKEK